MAHLLTIEVGARGYVAYSTERCFRQLGMQKRTVSSLCKSLSRVAARCICDLPISEKQGLGGQEKYENLALARSKAFTHDQLHQCGQHLKSQRATLQKEHGSDAGFKLSSEIPIVLFAKAILAVKSVINDVVVVADELDET